MYTTGVLPFYKARNELYKHKVIHEQLWQLVPVSQDHSTSVGWTVAGNQAYSVLSGIM